MIILLCGRDQCGLNAHSVDPDSMCIESWPVWEGLKKARGQGYGLGDSLHVLIGICK